MEIVIQAKDSDVETIDTCIKIINYDSDKD